MFITDMHVYNMHAYLQRLQTFALLHCLIEAGIELVCRTITTFWGQEFGPEIWIMGYNICSKSPFEAAQSLRES